MFANLEQSTSGSFKCLKIESAPKLMLRLMLKSPKLLETEIVRVFLFANSIFKTLESATLSKVF